MPADRQVQARPENQPVLDVARQFAHIEDIGCGGRIFQGNFGGHDNG
jgi:hypothetical protein